MTLCREDTMTTNIIIESKVLYDNFICSLHNTFNHEGYCHMFNAGIVKLLELNNRYAYFWQDANGNVCYSPNLLDKEYFSPSLTRLGNALSNHFQCNIEVVNNRGESFKKQTVAKTGLNKALAESQRYDEFSAYLQNNSTEPIVGEIGIFGSNNQKGLALLKDIGIPDNANGQILLDPALVYNQQLPQQPVYDQKQLHNEIIGLSTNRLEYSEQTRHLFVNELPVVNKEEFNPETKQAFFIDNALLKRNSYISTLYMSQFLSDYDINNSFTLLYIFYMAKNDPTQATKILVWLANSFNSLRKLPFTLVLHSESDTWMQLFYEEIIEPLFNPDHCEKIENDNLDGKQLSTKLDKKVIYNFHNIHTPTILKSPAKELTRRLMYKDNAKVYNKTISTKANILITSISKYIPLIAKDVPSLVVEVESSLEDFCQQNNIIADPYVVGNLIKNDLLNFASIVRSIDLDKLFNSYGFKCQYGTENTDIMDGDVDVLKVFEASIKSKNRVLFKILENKTPELYQKLMDDFDEDRVERTSLLAYFSSVFGKERFKNNRAIIKALKNLSTTSEPFENEKTFQIGKIVYYKLF